MELLVIKPSSLGDIIHGLVVVESFRQARPDVNVTWVVRDIFMPFVRGCNTVDRTIVFERGGGFAGLRRLYNALKEKPFDAVWDMQGLLRSGLMTACAVAPRKAGRADYREGAGLFYKEMPLLPSKEKPHAVEILLEFLPLFGVSPEVRGKVTFKDSAVMTGALAAIAEGSLLLFPNSRRKEKEWWGFEALTHELLLHYPQHKVIWAGDQAAPLPASLLDKPGLVDLRGILPIDALPGLINRSRLVIANDSGPVHLAAAMNKPVLAIFGPTDPALYGPYPLQGLSNKSLRAPGGDLQRLTVDAVLEEGVDFFL